MNKTQFATYIETPEALQAATVADLETLVNKYPFFQTAHLLYVKALHKQEHILYNNQLKVAAAYANDRKVLYELITKKAVMPQQLITIPVKQEIVVKEMPVEKHEEIVETIEQTKSDVNEKEIVESIEKKFEKIVEVKLEQLQHQLNETQKVIEQKLQQIEPTNTIAEEKNKEEAVKPPKDIQLIYSIEKESAVQLKSTVDIGELSSLAKEVMNKAIDASVEIEASKHIYDEKQKPITEIKEEKKQIEVQAEKTVEADSKQSFTAWLKTTKRQLTNREEERQHMLEIVDKFIKDDPRIVKNKADFFSSENMAKKSVEMGEELITETLAHIYVKQKNYSKAINAYRILMERNPEKKSYFEAIINEVKKVAEKK